MYQAQQAAMNEQADAEGECFERASVTPLATPSLIQKAPKKAKKSKGGSGFGAGKAKAAETPAARDAAARWRTLKKEGILKIEGACSPETAAALREYVIRDTADARASVEAARDDARASVSMLRFHAASEQPTRSFLLTPLDDETCHAGLRELLAPGRALGDVFELACGGDDCWFYDYNALRTERGSRRQPVHWDTPFQERPPLFTAFVALQRVTKEMGATMFLPTTHTLTAPRRQFDAGLTDGRRNAMLRECEARYALLEPGDVTIFDMRLLHCGTPNLLDLGDQRFFLNFTFCNPRADTSDLGHVPCIRPGYKRRMTLADVRAQLASESPFLDFGDGL